MILIILTGVEFLFVAATCRTYLPYVSLETMLLQGLVISIVHNVYEIISGLFDEEDNLESGRIQCGVSDINQEQLKKWRTQPRGAPYRDSAHSLSTRHAAGRGALTIR